MGMKLFLDAGAIIYLLEVTRSIFTIKGILSHATYHVERATS